jgi:NADH pyrophosphatase NudC (nudix superfamily)
LEVWPSTYKTHNKSNQELFYSVGLSLRDLQQSCMHCPTCGKPLTFIEQYDRWYCYNCKKYP